MWQKNLVALGVTRTGCRDSLRTRPAEKERLFTLEIDSIGNTPKKSRFRNPIVPHGFVRNRLFFTSARHGIMIARVGKVMPYFYSVDVTGMPPATGFFLPYGWNVTRRQRN